MLKNAGIYDYEVGEALLDMFVYSLNSFNSTVDNITDPHFRDYVVPDLKKVILKIFKLVLENILIKLTNRILANCNLLN
jgi:hypothetical protein